MLDSLPLIFPWRPPTVCTMMLAASQISNLHYLSELLIGSWGATQHTVYMNWLNKKLSYQESPLSIPAHAEFDNSMINLATKNSKFSFQLKTNSLLITYLQCLFNLLKINLSLQSRSSASIPPFTIWKLTMPASRTALRTDLFIHVWFNSTKLWQELSLRSL